MSWIRTLINVADIAVTANNAYQISQMKGQQQEAEVLNAYYRIFQEYLFQAGQIKEDLLYYKDKKPIAVAAGLFYLEAKIDESGISPDLFTDFSDKAHVANTIRDIRNSRNDLMEYFSPEQKELAETAGYALLNYESYAYLYETYNDRLLIDQSFRELDTLKRHEPSSGLFGNQKHKEWEAQVDQYKREINLLMEQVQPKEWDQLYDTHGRKEKDELENDIQNMEIIIQNVFEDPKLVPNLSMEQIVATQLTQGGGQALVQGQQQDQNRITCPNCGHSNSKHRSTCKKCRNQIK